ncbi:hypothetical protein KPSA3_06004 [Pseudomonas syringae pv. actinidiae]|uniref:Uncharacterized protein n=1 Tax=Pseudomonas syringae pv. actinidiae TaxID=103796 RepID=A0AAN4QAQ5_PSESF|nr:hypothetical protein KPSA3_06004 [Pseudomonas syringae pv. actinidiae]
MELLLLGSYHRSRPSELGWQLYAGWSTGAKGTQQARRPPTHSRHKTEMRTQKKRLQSEWGRCCAFCFSGDQARSLNLQRRPENNVRFWDVQLFERLALALDAKYI